MAVKRKKSHPKIHGNSKFKQEYCDEIIQFFQSFNPTLGGDGRLVPPMLPTANKFAIKIGVDETTIYEWAKTHPQFSQSLDVCKAIQKELLQDYGLNGCYNSTITKLILSSNHGVHEKTIEEKAGSVKVENVMDDEVVLRLKEIDEKLKKLKK